MISWNVLTFFCSILYAVDTSVLSIDKSLESLILYINQELMKTFEWLQSNQHSTNFSACMDLVFKMRPQLLLDMYAYRNYNHRRYRESLTIKVLGSFAWWEP